MSIQQKIKDDLKTSMKENNVEIRDTLRLLISEFQRRPNPHEELADKDAVSIISKLIKNEMEMQEHRGLKGQKNTYIEILERYVPKQASEEDVRSWIISNISDVLDIQPKARMKYMKQITSHFGAKCDGGTIKRILENL